MAAAKTSNCAFLLTEDLQDGQDLDGMRVINPFQHGPPERRQLLNFSSLANDCGIAVDTARRWISVLRTSFVIFLLPPPLFFWRDQQGHEVDLLIEYNSQLYAVEIKSGETVARSMQDGLTWWCHTAGEPASSATLVYGGEDHSERHGMAVCPWYGV